MRRAVVHLQQVAGAQLNHYGRHASFRSGVPPAYRAKTNGKGRAGPSVIRQEFLPRPALSQFRDLNAHSSKWRMKSPMPGVPCHDRAVFVRRTFLLAEEQLR